MIQKRNRQSLRGLSHQQKARTLQKITKVPLQNLKTNFAQSDLQEDDVSVPLSIQQSLNIKPPCENKTPQQFNSKKKVYDQQQINRTIRTMTKQLYTLEMEKQKQRKNAQQNQQTSVSIFSVEDFSFDLGVKQESNILTKAALDDFYSTAKNDPSANHIQPSELSQITDRLNRVENISYLPCQKILSKKQHHYRQSEPINFEQEIQPHKNVFSPRLELFKKNEFTESKVSKRFSRSKHHQDQLKEPNVQKKLKFNRSNQKKKLNYVIDKENIENVYTAKNGTLTERLSYHHLPTCETLETALKKRRNIAKNFITFQNQNLSQELSFQQTRPIPSQEAYQNKNNSLKKAICGFEEISQNKMFKLLQQGKTNTFMQNPLASSFMHELFNKYQEALGLLKTFQ